MLLLVPLQACFSRLFAAARRRTATIAAAPPSCCEAFGSPSAPISGAKKWARRCAGTWPHAGASAAGAARHPAQNASRIAAVCASPPTRFAMHARTLPSPVCTKVIVPKYQCHKVEAVMCHIAGGRYAHLVGIDYNNVHLERQGK